jgi:hypothetical protein
VSRFSKDETRAQKQQINELYDRFYARKGEQPKGEPAKYDVTPAGPQGNMFNIQAQAPKGARTSNIPLQRQCGGTIFERSTTDEPTFFDEVER